MSYQYQEVTSTNRSFNNKFLQNEICLFFRENSGHREKFMRIRKNTEISEGNLINQLGGNTAAG